MSDQDQECKIKIKEVISLVRTPRGPSPVEPTHPALEAMDQSPQAEVVTLDDHDLNARDPWRRPNYMEDVAGYSICPAINQLIASHLHRASGACRWLGKDVIVWTETPYTQIKSSKAACSDEVPWEKEDGTRKGKYSVMITHGPSSAEEGNRVDKVFWGISPPVQKLWINSDSILKELGLQLVDRPNPFVPAEEYSEENTIKVLVMVHDLIMQSPYRDNLKAYCALRD